MNIYKTHNVCSRSIEFEVENNIITACKFNGGCAGNTQGVAALVLARKQVAHIAAGGSAQKLAFGL